MINVGASVLGRAAQPRTAWGQPPPAVRRSDALPGLALGKKLSGCARLDSRGGCPHVVCAVYRGPYDYAAAPRSEAAPLRMTTNCTHAITGVLLTPAVPKTRR